MNKNQAERSQKINMIMQWLSEELARDKIPVKKDWILHVMDKFSTSERTAREYIDVAFLRLKI